jgi:hypothetical protein
MACLLGMPLAWERGARDDGLKADVAAGGRLGASESAIRKRVERGTLRSDKGSDGGRYVHLDTGSDTVADEGTDTSATGERYALLSELRAHNDTLREQL